MSGTTIITLDGPAGVGKSTIAKRLATELDLAYLDTGAMFRATAWKLGDGSWDWDEARLEDSLSFLEFFLEGSGGESVLSLNNAPIGDEVRTEQVGMWGSNVAKLPVVRDFLKQAQRRVGEKTSLVAEGRDMGTVVFPDARHKFFLDADLEERAKRRFKQLKAMGKPADLGELTEQIGLRDQQDRNRKVAPLRPAVDAEIVDTTHLDVDGVFERVLSLIREGKA